MNGFFAIGLAEWRKACSLGLNPAAAFLVLACGTGRDNQTTAWSANAVQEYAGISWVRAKPAIGLLEEAGLLEKTEYFTVNRPHYRLSLSDELIWLPKSIVLPVAGELPPVARIRQMQDVMILRLFIELYYAQNLAADGGLSREVYYDRYHKTLFCEQGQYLFAGFDRASDYVVWQTDVTRAHYATLSDEDKQAGKNPGHLFFKRIGALRELGLLEYSVCLFESEDSDAEILFPVDGPTPAEQAVKASAEAAVEAALPDWQCQANPHAYLVPLYRHQEKAALFGIYRLRHRPHTAQTSAWWATLQHRAEEAIDFFNTVAG